MANYTTTITNEGAALLASVIANQGTLTFNEFRFSENDYTGQESTLTEGTFLGVFVTASAAASVIDLTTIKASAQFNNSAITGNHNLYSIGIVGTDGNTTALIAVCTTTDPDVIREPLTGTSTYAFNVNLSVSDTSQITVAGTTAAALYDIDVVDNLISTATDKPLSANQGHLIADNITADENVYGSKNLNSYPYYETTKNENGITFTDNGDGTVTASGTALSTVYYAMHSRIQGSNNECIIKNGRYKASGCPSGGSSSTYSTTITYTSSGGSEVGFGNDYGSGFDFTVNGGYYSNDYVIISYLIVIKNGTALPVGGIIFKPMIRDDRVIDDTFVPFAKTNKQLTDDKAERNDLSTIHTTGSTNTTGATITSGTFFYLNGSFCKATADIAVNATFTENTNYKPTSLGSDTLKFKSISVNLLSHPCTSAEFGGYQTGQINVLPTGATEICALTVATTSGITTYPIVPKIYNASNIIIWLPYSASSGTIYFQMLYR